MNLVVARPPLFDEIDAAFKISGQPVLFAWGDTIYDPEGAGISPELREHEAVHGARQGSDVEGWWRRYIADPKFRLDEEIPAHRVEYQAFCRRHADRNARAKYLHNIAMRLSSPLYGSLVSHREATAMIKTP